MKTVLVILIGFAAMFASLLAPLATMGGVAIAFGFGLVTVFIGWCGFCSEVNSNSDLNRARARSINDKEA